MADALIDRYLATIPDAERMGVVRQIMVEVMSVLPTYPFFYNLEPTMVSHRVKNNVSRKSVKWATGSIQPSGSEAVVEMELPDGDT